MGFNLYLSFTSGELEEIPVGTEETALAAFDSFPWDRESEIWMALSDEDQKIFRPEFGLCDDTGRMLKIYRYSENLTAFSYMYPILEDEHGDQNSFRGTDKFPTEMNHSLIRAYFSGNHDQINAWLDEYVATPVNPPSE